MEPIHISLNAHLLSAQTSYRSAGIHGYIYHTLNALPSVNPGWRYTVMVGEGTPPEHPGLTILRARFSTVHPLRRILWEQMAQPVVLRRLQPDLHHAMAFVAPYFLKVPFLATVYDLSFLRYPDALSTSRRLYLRLFTRASCRRARRIIAISESTAQDLVEIMGIRREKINVAIPGVSPDFRRLESAQIAAFRQAQRLPERFLLHLGTLEPRKNLPLLLRAYAALPEKMRRDVNLVLAGGKGWDYQPIFETIEALNLKDMVYLPGFVDRDELPLWYNAAEALVYPSLFEGWGLPIVEAMACGCPTIISDVSSLPEAAGTTGLRQPPGDVSAWTDALHKAITDAAWRESSGEAGMARARQFTWHATAQATIQAYQQVLAEAE